MKLMKTFLALTMVMLLGATTAKSQVTVYKSNNYTGEKLDTSGN